MKKLFIALAIFAVTSVSAQLKTPAPSPLGSIEQTVGLTKIKIEYSRPGVKERKILGVKEPFGEMWRTGANASTKIEIENDITMGGMEVPAGKYSFYTIPGESEWTIVLNKNLEHWGVGDYTAEEDLVRFTVKPIKLTDLVETLTFDFNTFTAETANLVLSWENTKLIIPIGTKAGAMVESQIKELLIDGPSAGTYYAAARYYLEEGKDLNLALTWIDAALEKKPEAFWYMHRKAQIEAGLGKNKEAIATAQKSIELAKASEDGDYGYTAKNEKLIEELKAK
jgi:hypothetical protein